ncbi:3-hydroxyacyl-ACP dehydratase FabZ family protein [Actinokineospora sp. G85]|uniref:3-hydroxyacyl-ACP dehydratase FabZ family protein n=1 Tax=Actinokineospora sp. G85 TaxID=3406626 RepID=UPI003C794249
MTAVDPRDVLPHRFPMLLVDSVLAVEPGVSATVLKAVSRNEPWYAGSGGPQDYPEVLLVESWAQAAGIAIGAADPDPDVRTGSVMLFGSLADIEFHGPVRPGDVLEHRVRVVKALGGTVVLEGECLLRGEPVFTVSRMVVAYRPAESLARGTK